MKPTLKLYLITLRGFGGFYSTGIDNKRNYVVAPDSETAYKMVRADFDKRDFGFSSDRALESISILAEFGEYSEASSRLYLPDFPTVDPTIQSVIDAVKAANAAGKTIGQNIEKHLNEILKPNTPK